jgi:hypothetical protein
MCNPFSIVEMTTTTRDTVLKHLSTLGYSNVPEDIIQELVEELDNSILTEASSVLVGAKEEPTLTQQSTRMAISKQEVVKQLTQLGYDEATIPTDILEEIVQELNESIMGQSSILEQSVVSSPSDHDHSEILETGGIKTRRLEEIDLTEVRKLVERQRKNAPSGVIYRPTRPLISVPAATRDHIGCDYTKPKKTDPVRMYHNFKEIWENDPFLQRLENPSSYKSKQRMFGNVGYHHIMGGAQVIVSRRPKHKSSFSK